MRIPTVTVPTVALALAVAAAVWLAVPGLTDESAVSLQGDMPRYLMNGAFMYDLPGSGLVRPSSLMAHAEAYFARYPALSLGHHPPLLPVLIVPFFALFGVSVFSGKLAVLTSFVVAVVLLFKVAARMYDARVAAWSAGLFATAPLAVDFGQQVMAEMPAVAVTLAAVLYLLRFRQSGRPADYFWFIGWAIASLFCRQTAAFLFPAYVAIALRRGGLAAFRQPSVFWVTAVGVLGVVAAAIATVLFSPFNAAIVGYIVSESLDLARWSSAIRDMVTSEGLSLLWLFAAAGVVLAAWHRDRRVMPALFWLGSVVVAVVVVTGTADPARYGFLNLPALAIVAASVVAQPLAGWRRGLAVTVLALLVSVQAVQAARIRPVGASGYEAAASFVVRAAPNTAVLYSASVDTGYFVFFARKHDAARRLVVLRSDKILTTSYMGDLDFESRVERPDDIVEVLRRFGVRYVVLEDRPSDSRVLDWLRDLTRSPRFAERARFPTESRDRRLAGVSIVVAEFLDATPPAPDATLDLSLPLVGRDISVRLADLLAGVR